MQLLWITDPRRTRECARLVAESHVDIVLADNLDRS